MEVARQSPILPVETWVLVLSNLETSSVFRLATVSKIFEKQIVYESVTSISLSLPAEFFTVYLRDEKLEKFRNLKSLELARHHLLTNIGFKSMGNSLTALDLNSKYGISSNAIKELTNLISINLANKQYPESKFTFLKIEDYGIKYLTKISTLNLHGNDLITNEGIQHLTNITNLF